MKSLQPTLEKDLKNNNKTNKKKQKKEKGYFFETEREEYTS